MKKSKKAIIIFGIILLIFAAAIAGFFVSGNQIISGMFLRDNYEGSFLVRENGRIIVLHTSDKDEFSDYNNGDIITVVCGKEETLDDANYGTCVESYFCYRTGTGSTEDISAYFEKAEKCILYGRILNLKNGGLMLIDDHGSAYELQKNAEEHYFNFDDGDKVFVVCSYILETYPAQTDMHYCWLIEDGNYSDLPENTLETLREMGWID